MRAYRTERRFRLMIILAKCKNADDFIIVIWHMADQKSTCLTTSANRISSLRQPFDIMEKSWGDMVRTIDAERKTLPWKPDDFTKTRTITLAEV